MTKYERVQQILENAVEGETIGEHGNFWRNRTREEFIALQIFGTVPLIIVGDGAGSNLVKSLRGQPPFDNSQFPRMPVGFPPVQETDIAFIQQWIDDGCPDENWIPPDGNQPAATERTTRP
jgi:hypothetical protein